MTDTANILEPSWVSASAATAMEIAPAMRPRLSAISVMVSSP